MAYLEPERSAERGQLLRLGMFTLVLACGWLTLAGYLVHAALPGNPIHLPFEKSVHAKFWLEERWNFFVLGARDDLMVPFARRSDGTWVSANLWPAFRVNYVFGFRRRPRTQEREIGVLLEKLNGIAFTECNQDSKACLEQSPVAASLRNTFPSRSLCGDVGLVTQKTIPWAWRTSGDPPLMPSRFVRLNVDCP